MMMAKDTQTTTTTGPALLLGKFQTAGNRASLFFFYFCILLSFFSFSKQSYLRSLNHQLWHIYESRSLVKVAPTLQIRHTLLLSTETLSCNLKSYREDFHLSQNDVMLQ